MGAERTQKGAVGQQLAASGRARRAEAIRRKGGGEGGSNIGRDISRGVMEDQMERNDKEGRQKQGGRPGRPKPIDGKPIIGKPPRDIGGRPPKPPRDEIVKPLPYPPRGDDQYGPGIPGRPIGDDNWATLPYFPGKPPVGGRPGKPDMPDPRPPVEKHPWGREDDPNYGRRKDAWHQRRKEMEMKRKEDMWRKGRERKGGTDFGPGRGDRLPEGADQDSYLTPFSGQNLERPGAAATTLQDFMEQMANLRGGGFTR